MASAVLCCSMTLGAIALPLAASADGTSPTTTTTVVSPLKTWQNEMVNYRNADSAIRLSFQAAVSAAHSNLLSALQSATTSSARSTARAAFNLAISQAVSTRTAALNALGPAPVRPVLPTPSVKGKSSK